MEGLQRPPESPRCRGAGLCCWVRGEQSVVQGERRCRLPGTWACKNRAGTLPAVAGGRAGAGHVLEGVGCSFPTKFNSIPAKGEMPITPSCCGVERPRSLSGSGPPWCVPAAIECCCRLLFLFSGVLWSLAVGSLFPLAPSGAARAARGPGATACVCGGCPGGSAAGAAPAPPPVLRSGPSGSIPPWGHLQGARSGAVGAGGSAVRVPIPGVPGSLENVALSRRPSCPRAPQRHTPVGFATHLLCDGVSLAF